MAHAGWRLALLTGIVLLFCGWCILLGGLAGITDTCYDIPSGGATVANAVVTKAVFLQLNLESNINPQLNCGYMYGYYWWIWCLNLVVWCAALAVLMRPHSFRIGAAALTAVVTAANMQYTRDFLTFSRKLHSSGFGYGAVPSARASYAGFLICTISGFLLIIVIGSDCELTEHGAKRQVGPTAAAPPPHEDVWPKTGQAAAGGPVAEPPAPTGATAV